MPAIEMRDVSAGGHELGGATVEDLPPRATLRQVLAARIDAEVAAYNAAPGPTYVGLVQPEDAVRYRAGFRMHEPRPLDAEHLLTAVEEAVVAGVAVFRVGDRTVTDLAEEIDIAGTECITTVLRRPIVARRG